MAGHLCEWKIAEIISTVTMSSVYRVVRDAPIQRNSHVNKSFLCTFGVHLALVLPHFNGDITLGEIIPSLPKELQSHAVDIVVWLLRWHIICNVQKYLVEIPENTATKISDKVTLTPLEMRLRKKLKPYLGGDVPLCDIIWLESLREVIIYLP